jgi:hypothetical protein
VPIDEIVELLGYWNVEPFGNDWNRTAMQTLFLLKAHGATVDETFLEAFLPNYDPNRPMTQEEIDAELDKIHRRQQARLTGE